MVGFLNILFGDGTSQDLIADVIEVRIE